MTPDSGGTTKRRIGRAVLMTVAALGLLSTVGGVVSFYFEISSFPQAVRIVENRLWGVQAPRRPEVAVDVSATRLAEVIRAWQAVETDPNSVTGQQRLLYAVRSAAEVDETRLNPADRHRLQHSRLFARGLESGTVKGWNAILSLNPDEPLRHLVLEQRGRLADQEQMRTDQGRKNVTYGSNSPVIEGNTGSTITVGRDN